jgi:formylglycine-generating enzyme required for sulfatase activity
MQKNFVFTALFLAFLCLGAVETTFAAALKTYTNSMGMEFVLIPAGKVPSKRIGKNAFEEDIFSSFSVSRPFYLGTYEVTQAQWVALMGSNPSKFPGSNNPVEMVSWNDAQEFIRRLNAKEGHSRYRLPTETEWELAARGGTGTKYFFGATEGSLGDYAWFVRNSGKKTHPVGRKKPNPYGLYDIYGNVWEWVWDWHGDLPASREIRDYDGARSGTYRVFRGGAWDDFAESCRSGLRNGYLSDYRSGGVGFRLALSPE